MGRFSVTCVLLVPRVTRKHHLVQAPGPGVTVVFLTLLVLAQGGGVNQWWLCLPPKVRHLITMGHFGAKGQH